MTVTGVAVGYTLFDTAIGRCGIAWSDAGIVGVQLPEPNDRATAARLLKRVPGAEPTTPRPAVQAAIDGIVALMAGEHRDLGEIGLDMEAVAPFHRRVYDAARRIPPGTTRTYGQIAADLGDPTLARSVGQALGRNPFAIIVPCHRVVAANGKLGGFSANGGVTTKVRMLSIEGAAAAGGPTLFDGDGVLGFDPVDAVAHLRTADPVLGDFIEVAGPFSLELQTTPSIFTALAEAIVYQQLTAKAASTSISRRHSAISAAPTRSSPR